MLAYGCLETPSTMVLPQRLLLIEQGMASLIESHRPDIVAVERIFFKRNVETAFAVGQARGVILMVSARCGRADKGQVQRMVQTILHLAVLPRPDDAADALAIAICTAHAARPVAAPA